MQSTENQTNHQTPTLINFVEAASLLKVRHSWLRMAIFKKTIPYVKVGRLIRFNLKDLNKWLEKNSQN